MNKQPINEPYRFENGEVFHDKKEGIYAEFIGWQKDPNGDPIPLFNILGNHPNHGSTVDANTLCREGIPIPFVEKYK